MSMLIAAAISMALLSILSAVLAVMVGLGIQRLKNGVSSEWLPESSVSFSPSQAGTPTTSKRPSGEPFGRASSN